MDFFGDMLVQYPQFIYGGVGATALVAGSTLLYRIANRKKPTHVNVNCWFCDQDTVVPYGNRNRFDCPHCEQYNGFQENGDYNKPIPAQYKENLNHGVSAVTTPPETPKTLQWVNCQMLLCKKCNNNQTLKIKQLASFIPRDDDNYDEEIETYKYYLEQAYKLCRPCQMAVQSYIKHQNRQLRTQLFNHQLRRSREADKAFTMNTYSLPTPARVVFLRILAFLLCVFLLIVALCGSLEADPTATQSSPPTLSGGVAPPKQAQGNESTTEQSSGDGWQAGQVLTDLQNMLPEVVMEKVKGVWQYGVDHQTAVASTGLITCLTGVLLAGPIRLRRIDAIVCVLWFVVTCLYWSADYLKADAPGWLDMVQFGTTCLCCLVTFAAAVRPRKSLGQRRAAGRRSFFGGSVYNPPSPLLSVPTCASTFVPSPPPNLYHLIARHQQSQKARKASPYSLPGRLNRALSLGTIPSLTRTDAGYLFSGSRPSSQCQDSPPSDLFSQKSVSRPSSPAPSVADSVLSMSSHPLISPARLNLSGSRLQLFSSPQEPAAFMGGFLFSGSRPPSQCQDSPPSDYFSLKFGSRPSSAGPSSPTPSVAGSVTSTSSSARQRRPLISPARLNLSGSKLQLFTSPQEPPAFPTPPYTPDSFSNDLGSLHMRHTPELQEREDEFSESSASSKCPVDTTTANENESKSALPGVFTRSIWPKLLVVSLTANLTASVYLYLNWR
ncbi:transmembrane protein 201 isoform X2 [Engraulis encrasicolus]|uniref:transmembrane protein 201 isoform X2 n=1 Tax=Engraulis encrasicolus TaxID=184585 RepID=UPI002FD449C2